MTSDPLSTRAARLLEIQQQATCEHKNRTGGNDYLLCNECGFMWDYRRDPVGDKAMRQLLLAELTAAEAEIGKLEAVNDTLVEAWKTTSAFLDADRAKLKGANAVINEYDAQLKAAEAERDKARRERDATGAHLRETILELRSAEARAEGRAEWQPIATALLEPNAEYPSEPIHRRIERECWKQHHRDFVDCQEPACVLLKRVALAIGWTVDMNGVQALPASPGAEEPKENRRP